jgi:hypothetical protein
MGETPEQRIGRLFTESWAGKKPLSSNGFPELPPLTRETTYAYIKFARGLVGEPRGTLWFPFPILREQFVAIAARLRERQDLDPSLEFEGGVRRDALSVRMHKAVRWKVPETGRNAMLTLESQIIYRRLGPPRMSWPEVCASVSWGGRLVTLDDVRRVKAKADIVAELFDRSIETDEYLMAEYRLRYGTDSQTVDPHAAESARGVVGALSELTTLERGVLCLTSGFGGSPRQSLDQIVGLFGGPYDEVRRLQGSAEHKMSSSLPASAARVKGAWVTPSWIVWGDRNPAES